MSRQRTPLVARLADLDTRCSLCGQMILGYNGRGPVDMMGLEPVHPIDTLDQIVKVDGTWTWIHADCARDHGHEVI